MSKDFVTKIAERMLSKVVDIDNFELREPYKKIAVGVAKNGMNKLKHSKAMELIEKEPSIAVLKKVFKGKTKTLNAEQLADDTKVYNLYHILGVDKDADDDAIKKAFRTNAMKYHPDKNPGDKKAAAIFKRIAQANEVLTNVKKRSLYDEFGEISLQIAFNEEIARNGGYNNH